MARQSTSLGDALTWLLCRLWPWAKSQRAGGQYRANGEPCLVYISGDSGIFPPIHSSFSTNSEAVPVPRRKVVKLVQQKLQPPFLPPKPWKVLWQCIPMILYCFYFCRIRHFIFELQFVNILLSSTLSLQEKDSEILDNPKLGHVLCRPLQREVSTLSIPHCCPVFMTLHGPSLTP